MTLVQMEKRALYLEGLYQKFLMKSNYLGKKGPIGKLHDELNDLWKEISRRSRDLHNSQKEGT